MDNDDILRIMFVPMAAAILVMFLFIERVKGVPVEISLSSLDNHTICVTRTGYALSEESEVSKHE